jgi:hypothetical protein
VHFFSEDSGFWSFAGISPMRRYQVGNHSTTGSAEIKARQLIAMKDAD